MLKKWSAAIICNCVSAVLVLTVLPRCVIPAQADNSPNKDGPAVQIPALLNVTLLDSNGNAPKLLWRIEGQYGQDSPKTEAKGTIIAPVPINGVADRLGCDRQTRFLVPPNTKHWVALLHRGNCTFKEKIMRAAAFNASAVVIYNNMSKEETITMAHTGTGDIVVVMITESKGKELLSYIENHLTVMVSIMVGTRSMMKNINRGSLVFVSISFIVLMIISSAWLIFYFIQKIRYSNARDRSQRRLGDAAKKAISKLSTRTVKKGDKETDPDFNHCAVCIEGYKLNDVVRILPCKHIFHKMCVDPWLNEHCTCPMCKLNILKALGIMPNLPCVDNVAFDMDMISRSQTSSQRSILGDSTNENSISLEPLRHSGTSQSPLEAELTPRSGEINIAVTSGHFFSRSSLSPRNLVCEIELPDIQPSLDLYDDNKS
ncbi:GOLI ligase, partial [Polyodon spathula]|nr:E3 ubiquitin-protein ligase RNF130 isoform X2 [Polyodon spathula]MBN3276318.1 GOLI ligase [Polyodon spathula]